MAEVCILKQPQSDAFSEELQSLMSEKELRTQSKLKCLHLFLRNGLIVVGGMLKNSILSIFRKYPIVLPTNSKVIRLIFEQRHREKLHCGISGSATEVLAVKRSSNGPVYSIPLRQMHTC